MKRYLVGGLTCAVMGFLLALEVRTLTTKEALAYEQSRSTEDLVVQLIQVNKERDRLQAELAALRALATERATRARLAAQVREEGAAAGLGGLHGPGIVVTLQGDKALGEDLLRLVNEMRASGAEGMAIGHVRLTERTRFDGPPAAINGVALPAEVEIRAIGDPQLLSAGLTMRGGILDELRNYYQIGLRVEERLEIPPVAAASPHRYARASR